MKISELTSIIDIGFLLKKYQYTEEDTVKILTDYRDHTRPDELTGIDYKATEYEVDSTAALQFLTSHFATRERLMQKIISLKSKVKDISLKNALKYIDRGFNLNRSRLDRIYNLATVRGMLLGEIGCEDPDINIIYKEIKGEIMSLSYAIAFEPGEINDDDLPNELGINNISI